MPVLYVFGRNPIDVDDAVAKVLAGVTDVATRPLVLLRDTAFEHAIPAIHERLGAAGVTVVCPVIPLSADPTAGAGSNAGAASSAADGGAAAASSAASGTGAGATSGAVAAAGAAEAGSSGAGSAEGADAGEGGSERDHATKDVVELLGSHEARSTLTIGGQSCPLPAGVTPPDCNIVYIGEQVRARVPAIAKADAADPTTALCVCWLPADPDATLDAPDRAFRRHGLCAQGPRLTHIGMRYSSTPCWSFSPATGALRQETAEVNSALMRRYYLIEQATEARVFGIVVGTLGVARFVCWPRLCGTMVAC